jgi:hypothetical protein
MIAMGFKDRGHTKFCFKSYDEDDLSDDYQDDLLLPQKRRLRYYDGPVKFKDNFNGVGYQPLPNELRKIICIINE